MNVTNHPAFPSLCTSCQMCSAVCPTKAISIELDKDGFYRPAVDPALCTDCGLCTKTCRCFLEVPKSDEALEAWACRAADPEVLAATTSGGIADLLSHAAVQAGWSVLGVIYDYRTHRAVAEIRSNQPEAFRGSKYIQSYTAEAYRDLLQRAKTQKLLVFGLPCQIYAIDKAARDRHIRQNLVLVDLFCHGCPSMHLWDKYLNHIKETFGLNVIDSVVFRSKKAGWHEFRTCIGSQRQAYLSKNESDLFYQLFFSNHVLNETCADCASRSTLHACDIRLGDFWGAAYDEDIRGVSAVVAVTDAGKALLHQLPQEVFLQQHTLEEICKCQSYGTCYPMDPVLRKSLLKHLAGPDSIRETAKLYFKKLPAKKKLKHYAKQVFLLLPRSLRLKLKKRVHST